MKSTHQAVKLICGACAMLVLILDAQTALRGGSEGISLCLRSVIPALFPFLICSAYLTGNLGSVSIPLLRPIGRICRVPSGSEGILLTGLLGGYPVGAQSIRQAWDAGIIDSENARRMLGFCNNAGPAFLFGILSPYFSSAHKLWILWGIHIASALTVGILLPCGSNITAISNGHGNITFPQALTKAVRTMGTICGWVICFRTIHVFADRWFLHLLPGENAVLLAGLLELTNGCVNLGNINSEPLRFMMAAVFLSTGGLCVGMQTVSVTAGLGIGWYFPGKLLQTGITGLLCGLIIPVLYPQSTLPWLIPASVPLILLWVYFFLIRKNNSSNFRLNGV